MEDQRVEKYKQLISNGVDPQRAKSLLNQSTATAQVEPKKEWLSFADKLKTWLSKFNTLVWADKWTSLQQVIAPSAWLIAGIWKVAEKTVWKWMDVLWGKLFWDSYWKVWWLTDKVVPKALWWAEQWIWYKAWEVIGKNLPSIAATAWLWGVSWWLTARAVKGAWLWALNTQANTYLTEWRLATGKETLVWAWLWGVLWGALWWQSKKAIQKLVQPKTTATVERKAAEKWLKSTNLLWKVKLAASNREKQMAEVWKEFLNPSKTITSNVNKTISQIEKEAKNLSSIIKDNPTWIPTSNLKSALNKVEMPISIKWDKTLEKQYWLIKKKILELYNNQPKKNGIWLLETRKQIDNIISNEYPNLYSSQALSPLKIAITKLREVPNKLIWEKIWWKVVKDSLTKQSLLYSIRDNLATKTEKTWSSAVSRLIQKNKKKLWTAGAVAWWIYWLKALKNLVWWQD